MAAQKSGRGGPTAPDIEAAKSHRFPEEAFHYDADTAILYALGVGVSTQNENGLNYLYEGSDDFMVLPSFAVIPAQRSLVGLITANLGGIQMDPTRLLHGEQYIEILKPLPTSGKFVSKARIADIVDKGSGAVIVLEVDTFDAAGQRCIFNQFVIFIVGSGGFGGKRSSDAMRPTAAVPSRAPDKTVRQQTSVDQAALYRLSGDKNPIHINPQIAGLAGFSRPILHGLCSLGFAVRHVMDAYCDGDSRKCKAIKVRFAKPVLPGETLQTDMWREGNRIVFQTKVVENGNIVLSGGYIDAAISDALVATPSAASSSSQLKSDAVFKDMETRVKSNPALADQINAIFEWHIQKDGKTAAVWTVDLKSKPGSVRQGAAQGDKPGCTFIVDDDDCVLMATGKLNPQQAFMKGKLKIKGNIMLSQKLAGLFQQQAKL